MDNIPIIPGRGLIQPTAIQTRTHFLESLGCSIDAIKNHNLFLPEIQNNIESFIGSVEIPLGVVGPLLYVTESNEELVYTVAGTLEGALIASMNRGARAVSLSGGFSAKVLHQKMLRAPMLVFAEQKYTHIFEDWVANKFLLIKKQAELHSNHAALLKIDMVSIENQTHLKFIFTTGDASGQNMTTTCTWHALLWIVENFQKESGLPIEKFIIEGNASSDKKLSKYTITEGRGINVTTHCILKDEFIEKILRTNSEDFISFYEPSRKIAERDGMVGYNINVANAIASIFLATGQDMASVHESSHGILTIKKHADGLDVSLNLTNLVIGTIGGGTHLSKQKEALELMNCYGTHKVERFASLIAGFSLALELSTYAAIVSGAFAKAHEQLGRNKPVNWLVRSEINADFIKKIIQPKLDTQKIISIEIDWNNLIENGIITHITNKVSKKIIGFVPVTINYFDSEVQKKECLLLKLKALDIEVVKGLHVLAALIDPVLADLISQNMKVLEYWNCHHKELKLYEVLNKNNFKCTPKYWGQMIDESREIYALLMEHLDPENIEHINTQKKPELWTQEQIECTIKEITNIHVFFQDEENRIELAEITEFRPWEAKGMYQKFISIMLKEAIGTEKFEIVNRLSAFSDQLEGMNGELNIAKTLIHNDFNSRNIAILKSSKLNEAQSPCFYDWELAVLNIPHRDIVEFLSFVLVEDFLADDLNLILNYHYNLYKNHTSCSKDEWWQGYNYAIKEFLVTRVSFYEVAGIHAKYAFSERVLKCGFRILDFLEK